MSLQKKQKKSKKNQDGNRKAGTRINPQQRKKNQDIIKMLEGDQSNLQSAAAAYSRKAVTRAPREKVSKAGARTIFYKEYVQDILGSVAFATTSFICNPGLSNLFAWLSGQALFYQEYTVKRLKFHYDTEKSTALSGKVMFAFLQDSSDPAPASKQELMENMMKASGAIWQPFDLPINMSNFPALGKSRFIRGGNLAANLDQKTYDIGLLVVGTLGCADASAIGELSVEYEIELRTPIQSIAQLANSLSEKIDGVTTSNISFMGAVPTLTGGLDLSAAVNTITFNKVGQYLLAIVITGTGLFTNYTPVVTGTATTTKLNGISNAAANAGTIAMINYLVTVTARGQTSIIDMTTQATTITASASRLATYATTLIA
jgi:hypothetical protein